MNCVIKTAATPYAFPWAEAPRSSFRKTIRVPFWRAWNLDAGLPLASLPIAISIPSPIPIPILIPTHIRIDTFYDPSADVSLAVFFVVPPIPCHIPISGALCFARHIRSCQLG